MKKITLEEAIQIAVRAHVGQKDKALAPYIFHPLRVMLHMKTKDEMITAILHDVLEDSNITLLFLKKLGLSPHILKALGLLTRRKNCPYDLYLAMLRNNQLALKVKLADLKDNMNIQRLQKVTARDKARLQKYKKSYSTLTSKR